MAGYKEADASADSAEMNKTRGGVPFFTPKGEKGKFVTSYVRMLPPREDHPTNSYFYWASVHGNLPGAGRPVLCPARMNDRPCPACMTARAYDQKGDKEAARPFWPSWRALVNVCIVDANGNPDPDREGVFVWAVPKTLMEDLETLVKALPEKQRNISSPKKGRDVIIKRKGTGQTDTKYNVDLAEPSEVPQAIYDLLEDGLFYLPDIYPELGADKITAMLTAGDSFETTPSQITEGEYREMPAPTSNRRPPAEDDDDDVPSAAELAPRNVDEARRRLEQHLGATLAGTAPFDTDDDDDDDEDD